MEDKKVKRRRCRREGCNRLTSKTHERYYCDACYRALMKDHYRRNKKRIIEERKAYRQRKREEKRQAQENQE